MGLEYHGLLLTYAERKGAPRLERLMHDKGEGFHYEREMELKIPLSYFPGLMQLGFCLFACFSFCFREEGKGR